MTLTDQRRLSTLAALVLILLLASALRLYHLGVPSLGGEEAHSVQISAQPVGAIFSQGQPPAYPLILKAWRALTGDSEFSQRALSALLGVLTAAALYAIAASL